MAGRGPINDIETDIPSSRISYDVEAFDEMLRSQGVRLVHWSAMRCPVGMTDIDDHQQVHDDHEGCSNGFLYTRQGVITALFIGNSKNKRPDDVGFWDGSTSQVTFPRFYDAEEGCVGVDEKRLYVAPFDRFYLEEEVTVPTWQLFLHHASGQDRLKYPVKEVISLTDAAGRQYHQDDDFQLKNGQLIWGSNQPSPQLGSRTDRGQVCSVRYLYTPYWYVGQVMHEIRVSQVTRDGVRGIERMPQSVMLHREYMAQNKDQAEPGSGRVDADALRTMLGPTYGGFGPK